MKQAEQKGTLAPAKPDEVTVKQGEAALAVVKQGLSSTATTTRTTSGHGGSLFSSPT